MLTCCEQTIRKLCEDVGAELAEVNGQHNHGHLLVTWPPKVAVSALPKLAQRSLGLAATAGNPPAG
jgi:REP element-mobilizing transposase RayT